MHARARTHVSRHLICLPGRTALRDVPARSQPNISAHTSINCLTVAAAPPQKVGYFPSQQTYACEQCMFGCLQCASASTCQICSVPQYKLIYGICRCDNGYFRLGDNCVETCPIGYFGNLETVFCQLCSVPGCGRCDSQNNCLECLSTSNFIYQGRCYSRYKPNYLPFLAMCAWVDKLHSFMLSFFACFLMGFHCLAVPLSRRFF